MNNSMEERAQIGFTMFMDIFEGRYLFVDLVASGAADTEIRLAIFYALHGRYPNAENTVDALAVFVGDVTGPLTMVREKAKLYLEKGRAAQLPVEVYKALETTAIAMRKMADIPATMQHRLNRRTGYLENVQEENRKQQRIDSFNSQHKPAPEGTVKELAAKYGKSLGEIRKLKAEGLLHTLSEGAV